MLQYHSIGAGAIGLIPFVDVIVQKAVIQQSAAKKIGQIFEVDIKIVEKENKSLSLNQEAVEIKEEPNYLN